MQDHIHAHGLPSDVPVNVAVVQCISAVTDNPKLCGHLMLSWIALERNACGQARLVMIMCFYLSDLVGNVVSGLTCYSQ